jgi:glycerol-1-phosphate dehydrogenase [NAD(P)+]
VFDATFNQNRSDILGNRIPVYFGNRTIPELVKYCQAQGFDKFLLVADQNTYLAFGKTVEEALKSQGYDVILARLEGDELIADEYYLTQVFLKADRQERIFLAVGSGTLTDITRFTSHRTKTSFISIPTAPSVDGFISLGAPLVVDGLKRTYLCHAPVALFADLPTLCSAPRALIASGFGDLVGKLLSANDWKLGHLLWDEAYDEGIYQHFITAAMNCVPQAEEIGHATEAGVRLLIEGLIESGFGMLDFGNSNPASGAEHHISHFWEMKLLHEHRPAIFHGLKVGVASVVTAGWYDSLRALKKDEVASRLARVDNLRPGEMVENIHKMYGPVADQVIDDQREFIFMDVKRMADLEQRILDCWDEVLEIANAVPSSAMIKEWLRLGGAPITGGEIGLGDEEFQLGLDYGHYLRKRFTINKLRFYLNI